MSKTYLPTFLLLMIFILACGESPSTPEKPDTPETPPVAPPAPIVKNVSMIVTIDDLRIREEAGPKGKELTRLAEGSKVTEEGEISDFTTSVQLRGIQYDDPWVKIKTAEGQVGWAYAAGLRYENANANTITKQLMLQRMRSFFGNDLTNSINTYREQYGQIKDSESFRTVYRQGVNLRDRMVKQLEKRAKNVDGVQMPDLSWLEQALPGYTAQLVAEGTQPYLFANYKKWDSRAKATSETEDDEFTKICMQVHAVDSVEYFFPAWFLQTWDYGGHSLLGDGIHLSVLKNMEAAKQKNPLFEEEMKAIKEEILADISSEHLEYWNSQENILKEIDDILAANFSLVSSEDRVALSTRRDMFKDYKENKIKLNLRAGEGG